MKMASSAPKRLLPLLGCLLLLFTCGCAQSDSSSYSVSLQNLFISHGVLEPQFSPDVLDYTVNLRHAHDQIAITPEIDQTRPEYQGGENSYPVVTLQWGGRQNKPESASIAVRRQIDLPDRGESMTIHIIVANPNNAEQKLTYSITVNQSSEPVVVLKSLEAVDDLGKPVAIEPITNQDDVIYQFYVQPDASSISFKPQCADGNWVMLDGRTIANEDVTLITREKDHHRQLLELTCGRSQGIRGSISRKYLLAIFSDFAEDDIPAPRLVVEGRGKDCVFNTDHQRYDCPNPRAQDYRTRVIGFSEPSIRYTIESSDNTVQVRLLDQVPSIPFSYTGVGDLTLVGLAGQHSKVWPVRFNGAPTPGLMRVIGWLLGLKLVVLLLSLLAVLGLSNTFGIGTPIGVTEIATAMTLLLQFFCFSSALRGSSLLSDMTEAMKWVTLYWPLPWNVGDHNNFSRWGDVSDVTNAYGCLFWAAILFLLLLALHAAVVCKFKCIDRRSTFPHRLAFGNWESRCLHWLAFPVATASGMILSHPDATPGWKGVAGCTLVGYFVWAAGIFFVLRNSISSKQVIWVWHNSAREDGELEDEAGYWSDIHCDQLLTQPVNRSLFKWFFPWRWVSTVGDIEPVNICPRAFARGADEENGDLFPVNEFHRTHKESTYPLGKNPKPVDVMRTMPPSALCPGQRLIAGLMRTQWVDILFSYQALTKFHTYMADETGRDFAVPLTVKTCQLTGPVTGGANHFFYDGARVPFIRIGDTIFRLVIGVCMGLILASQSFKLDVAMFGSIGVLAVALLCYHFVGWPYARKLENWILAALLFSIATTSFAFTGYSISESEPSAFADVFLWLNAITSVLLALYACMVIFSVYSAIMCPPLEETRFLEKLANCNVAISDHDAGWVVDVPAYNKYGARDLKAQCTMSGSKVHVSIYPSGEEATIEFDSHEMLQACQSGTLRPPVLCLFCPDSTSPLGYRCTNIYDKGSLHADVAGFLAMNKRTRNLADSVARNIAHQVEMRGARGKAVVSLAIVPPMDDDASSTITTSYQSSRSQPRYRSGYASIEMTEK